MLGLTLVAAVCAAEEGPQSPDGTWQVSDATVAPWCSPERAGCAFGTDLHGETIVIAAGPGGASLRGPGALVCEHASVERLELPAEGLFEGNLPPPAEGAAAALGLTRFPVVAWRITCANGGFDFLHRDETTLLLALDNRVWWLSRVASAP
ncbi:MAG: hypothetical protein ACK4KV_06335 [Rhodocyclaceae bacterium]